MGYLKHLQNKTNRLLAKNGECLVANKIPTKERILGYIGDSFTGYVEMKWRYHFVIFFGTFFFSWSVMGLIWSSTVRVDEHRSNTTDKRLESSCIKSVENIVQAILFAYESQSTVGYGYRDLLSECNPGGYIFHFIQIFVGVLLPTLLGGVLFVKTRRPKRRHETIMFSKFATIFDENIIEQVEISSNNRSKKIKKGYYRARIRRKFQFRIGDIRHSRIVSMSVRVILVKDRRTDEGEVIPFCMHQLPICTFPGGSEDATENPSLAFLAWPVLISHEIDGNSPLKDVKKSGLDFEIMVLLEGVVEPTGKPSQFRTSYTPKEILWNCRFAPIVMEFKSNRGERGLKDMINVDYSSFDEVIPLLRTVSHEEIVTRNEIAPK